MFEIMIERAFSAAHFLPDFVGKCQRLHGHNYRVQVFLRGDQLDKNGLLAEFGAVKAVLDSLLETYDHYCLNELPDFAEMPPSTENIARRIAERLTNAKSDLAGYDFGAARVDRVTVYETPIQSATYFC